MSPSLGIFSSDVSPDDDKYLVETINHTFVATYVAHVLTNVNCKFGFASIVSESVSLFEFAD